MADAWTVASTVATAAAVVVALGVALNEGRARAAERRDQAAAQARLVTVVLRGDEVFVNNHSQAPILELRPGHAVETTPAGTNRALIMQYSAPYNDLRAMPPGSYIGFRLAYQDSGAPWSHLEGAGACATVFFLDAAGLWWERSSVGQPVRLLGAPGQST